MTAPDAPDLPLTGRLVVDLTRMLPGAVLVRTLVDLGARVVKVEDPASGDPLRSSGPFVDGVGAAYNAFFRGVESAALDLRTESGRNAVHALAARADVLVESFRPGTLERWGLGDEALAAANPRLVVCALPGFPSDAPEAGHALHDLNVAARSGLLSQLPGTFPRIQVADVSTGLLGAASILAALLARERTGRGMRIEQPLAAGPLPFLTWALAGAAAGAEEIAGGLFTGHFPAYGRYRCADGVEISVAVLEPKFWKELLEVVALPELAPFALAGDAPGRGARERLAERLAERPSAEWLALAAARGLPLARVNSTDEAIADPVYGRMLAPASGAEGSLGPIAYLYSWAGRRALAPAERLGESTARVLAELGLPSL